MNLLTRLIVRGPESWVRPPYDPPVPTPAPWPALRGDDARWVDRMLAAVDLPAKYGVRPR